MVIMRELIGFVLVALSALALGTTVSAQSASDARMEGARLAEFMKTKGGSELGNDICWRVPSTAFGRAVRAKGGFELHVHRGVAILVRAEDPGLLEVRRRAGFASLRGRIVRVPPGRREKGDPEFVLEVREVLRRSAPEAGGTKRRG